LRGRVRPIGGLKEKVLAAHRIGITTILLPEDNESDLADIPPDIRKKLTFRFVKTMDEVIAQALLPKSDVVIAPAPSEPPELEEVAAAELDDRPRSEPPAQPSL